MTKFEVGDKATYRECPPNWGKIREHCTWTDDVLVQSMKEFENSATVEVEIVEVYPADEEGEPEQYKIRFIDNPQLEKECKGFRYAHHSELS